jgi:glycerate kinase
VAEHLAAGLRRVAPHAEVRQLPVADGGEGTVAAAVAAGFRPVTVPVSGPTGRTVRASLAVRDYTAVIELATASGLAVLPDDRLDPLGASSFGTGQLIAAALDQGCRDLVLGVGGSACTDGGAGLLVALGARLLDQAGYELAAGGGALRRLHRVSLTGLDPRLRETRLILAADVDSPLLGPHGAAAVFGPQKGADPAAVATLELGQRRWVAALTTALGPAAATAANAPGAGAAGGVGYAVLAVLGGRRRPGAQVVLELAGLADQLAEATLVITGEGSLDHQTLHGKAPVGVAEAARRAGIPAVAVAGRSLLRPSELTDAGLAAAYSLIDLEPDQHRCMANAGPLLERLAHRIARDWLAAPSGASAQHGSAFS